MVVLAGSVKPNVFILVGGFRLGLRFRLGLKFGFRLGLDFGCRLGLGSGWI